MTDAILCVLRSYQSLIVGLLGFTGVIITMLANARMQRSQHERVCLHEANSVRVAAKTELEANKKAYELRIEQLNEQPKDHTEALVPSRVLDNIYKEMLSKFGLLSEEELKNIINAYALITELPYKLRILVGTDNIGGYNNEFIRVGDGKHIIASKMHENILPAINEAISSIENHLKFA